MWSRQFAKFTLPNGDTVYGEFLLDGPRTGVILYVERLYTPRSVDFARFTPTCLPTDACLSWMHCTTNPAPAPLSTLCYSRLVRLFAVCTNPSARRRS